MESSKKQNSKGKPLQKKNEQNQNQKNFKKASPKNVFMDDLYDEIKSFISERRKDQPEGEKKEKKKVGQSKSHAKKGGQQKRYSKPQKKTGEKKKPLHHNSKPFDKVSLEPRDAQHFLMKPSKPNPKKFPYLTPKASFERHISHPKEKHKKRTDKGTLRIIPFGGLEQVGINCIGFEYNNEVLIIDMGIQFPDEHMHGVQGRIPDLSYVKGKKVVAVAITHGHIDHIGGIPQGMRQLGAQIPMYATPMTLELIKTKQEDFKMPLNLQEFKRNKVYKCGEYFYIEPFTVDHSIPDSVGVRIHTPVGKFIHTGDWKFDSDPRPNVPSVDHEQLKQFGKEGVRALLSDSTNAHLQGSALSEKIVIEPLEEIFSQAKGRVFTGTFSSIIERIQIILETAQKYNRKVVLLGRGMNMYSDIARKLGYLKAPQDVFISMEEAEQLPDDQVCICCTGAQGERYAALMRIATGESKDTEFKPGDSVILSSSVIPGNERRVQELMDILYEQNVNIHHYRQTAVHAGGHARQDDIEVMINETKPEYFIPIYGSRFMIHNNARIAKDLGYTDDKIFTAHNGQIMEFTKEKGELTHFHASHKMVTIDGYTIGFSNEKEMVERYQMGDSGVVVVNISEQKGKARAHIIGHGFVNLSLIQDFQNELKDEVIKLYKDGKAKKQNRDDSNKAIRKRVQSMIWNRLGKEPVVIVAS